MKLIVVFVFCSDEDYADSPDIEDESWLASLIASSPSPVPESNTWNKNKIVLLWLSQHSIYAFANWTCFTVPFLCIV